MRTRPFCRRRCTLPIVAAIAIAFLGTPTARATTDPWTIVALPDTQKYVQDGGEFQPFLDQTNWIVNNLATQNIVFVTHEGDVVEHGSNPTEWGRADQAMDALDGVVPYGVAIGNHDYMTTSNRASGADNYVATFGPSRYAGQPWYGGSSPNGLNHYQFFDGGAYTFLHLSLEWEVEGAPFNPASAMGWAQSILAAHPNTPTIITTHSYIWDEPGQEGRTQSAQSSGGNSGEAIFQQLVSPNPQVFMVLNGHWHRAASGVDGEFHQVSTNLSGLPVYEMLADYQDYTGGGQGWLRTLAFVPGGGAGGSDRIQIETYSPTRGLHQTDANSQFAFDLDFAGRFDVSGVARPQMAVFQQGMGGYGGTVDTFLQENSPTADQSAAAPLNVDSDDPSGSGKDVQALLRFEDIFGAGPGQVPAGATILEATLILQVENSGNAFWLHRMLADWADTDTWDSLVAGVQADNVEAASLAELLTGSVGKGGLALDVTAALLAWQADPASNKGWVFLPTGTDGVDFYSAEGSIPPMLIVSYIPEPGTLAMLVAGALVLLRRPRT